MKLKKLIQTTASAILMVCALSVPAVLSDGTIAQAALRDEVCKGVSGIGGGNACTTSAEGGKLGNFIGRIINILLFIVGAIAVIMIIVGGIRYITSGGDSNSVSAAKNTVLYSVIGLIVAVMAYAIVNFILAQLPK